MLRCDFCGELGRRVDLQILEFLCFDDPELKNDSPLWAACVECSALVIKGDWSALVRRSQLLHLLRGEMSGATEAIYDALRRNLVGGPRPHRASDYEGWT